MDFQNRLIIHLKEDILKRWQHEKDTNDRLNATCLTEEEKFKTSTLEECAKSYFNMRINCGGYALEIDLCVFNDNTKNFEQNVSELLEKLPFIRLLGDTELTDDEYIVLYRAAPECGHHFVKIKDGKMTDKNGCGDVKEFTDWSSLTNAPQAVFAVRKEHPIVFKDYFSGKKSITLRINGETGKDFDDTVKDSILNKQNTFSYHNHDYSLKFNKETNQKLVYSNGRLIGEILEDGDETIVVINDEEKDYVSNTKSTNRTYLEVIKKYEDKTKAKENKDDFER